MPVPFATGPVLFAEGVAYSDGDLETLAPATWSATNYIASNSPLRLSAISGRIGHASDGVYRDSQTVPTFGHADYSFELAEVPGNNRHVFVYIMAGAGGAYVMRIFRDDGNNRDDIRLYRATAPETLNPSLAQHYTTSTTRLEAGVGLGLRVNAGGTPIELYRRIAGVWTLRDNLAADPTVDVASPITTPGTFALETQSALTRFDNIAVTALEQPASGLAPIGSLALLGVGR